MFEFTKSFWRRLLGRSAHERQASAVAVADGAEDRRVWVRFPADMDTAIKSAGAAESTRLSVNVRNISLGGINLLASHCFQPGEMLSIELPGATDDTFCNVLACVVHCKPDEDGQWSLGCSFSRELSSDDLACFGAKRERLPDDDQREWKRFACDVSATFQLVATYDPILHPAKVLNISVTGVGLAVNRFVENGTLLSVELHNGAGTTERTMLACVVHVQRKGEGDWDLGCNFIRSLSEEDLRALV